MTIRIILFLIAALAAGRALAEDAARPAPFDAGKYPAEVQRALRYADEECKFQGGGGVTFAPDTVQMVDLTGDGRDDYIVDFRDTQCAEREAAYCGTGGCVMDILVTLPNGGIRRVFDGRVRNYEIGPGLAGKQRTSRTIRFELHGAYCGGHGSPSCYREKRITAVPFEFKMPK